LLLLPAMLLALPLLLLCCCSSTTQLLQSSKDTAVTAVYGTLPQQLSTSCYTTEQYSCNAVHRQLLAITNISASKTQTAAITEM
jgi:hypothetical protein